MTTTSRTLRRRSDAGGKEPESGCNAVGGDFIKIPLPWGYNVFHVMGQAVGEMLTKPGATAASAVGRVIGASIDAFKPIGGSVSPLQFISPTIIDPIAQWNENKDWASRPILGFLRF